MLSPQGNVETSGLSKSKEFRRFFSDLSSEMPVLIRIFGLGIIAEGKELTVF